jgi:hypothetical protein
MKKIDQFARHLWVGGIALALALPVTPAAAEPVHQVVQVVAVEGNAQWSTGGAPYQSVKKGDVYEAGTVIRTADNSHVDVMLGDEGSASGAMGGPSVVSAPDSAAGGGGGGGGGANGEEATANMIRIFPMTILSVDKLGLDRTGQDETADTQLDLRTGQIMSNTKKLALPSRYEIKIVGGVASIRGNCNVLSAGGKCASIYGTVKLALLQTDGSIKTWEVGAKHFFDPDAGKISDISDSDYKAYLKLYDALCQGAPRPPFKHDHDHTYHHTSDLGGTPTH